MHQDRKLTQKAEKIAIRSALSTRSWPSYDAGTQIFIGSGKKRIIMLLSESNPPAFVIKNHQKRLGFNLSLDELP